MGGPLQVVDQNRTPDPDFISEQAGMRKFGLKRVVSTHQLAGVRLPGINEEPGGIGMAIGRLAKQRTLR